MESYTDAYLLVDGATELMTYSDEYDQLIQSMTDQLEPLGEERAALRAQTVRQEMCIRDREYIALILIIVLYTIVEIKK